MKFLVAVLLTYLFGYTAFLYSDVVPWYAFAIGALFVGIVVPQKGWQSWLSGFCGLLICWGALAWYMDKGNESLFSAKMALVLPLQGSSTMLVIITALVGAIIAGFACLSGGFLRRK